MVVALVIDQIIGWSLISAFGGFVLADLTRPRKRRSRIQPSAEDGGKPRGERSA